MKRMNIVVVGLLVAATSVAAQERPQPSVSPEIQLQQRRFQFKMMESVFVNAVKQGIQEVAERAQGVLPTSMLFFGMPKANGFPLDPFGVIFDVEIPEIRESAVLLNQFPRPTLGVGPQNVASGSGASGTARATGVVPDDPMARSPVTSDPFLADPDKFYRDVITERLVSVMLDFSKMLEIQDGQWLSVVARGEKAPIQTNPYDDSRALILRVKGEDLALFHAGKITREEMRKRVLQSDF